MRLLTSTEARELDARASALGIGVAALMEVAGAKAALVARRAFGEGGGRNALVLAGRGNNGGDGLAAARYLRNAGFNVRVYLCGGEPLRAEAARNLAAWKDSDGWWRAPEPGDDFWRELEGDVFGWADLVLDALLGIGQTEPPRGDAGKAAGLLARTGGMGQGAPAVLSLDVPTGVNADTGQAYVPAVKADVTVTFGLPKVGLMLYPGADLAGELVVADIGMPPLPPVQDAQGAFPPAAWLCDAAAAAPLMPPRPRAFHKGDAGVVIAIGGSVGMTGAAALMGRAAVRAGAGLVTVGTPAPAQPVVAGMLSEAMTAPLAARDGAIAPEAIEAALALAGESDVVAFGPGLRRSPGAEEFARAFVDLCPRPLVLDADGLNAFAGHPELLRRRSSGSPLIITPHPGELARLLATDASSIQSDRIAWARRAAAATGAVCVLKGAATVVSAPGGDCWVVPAGNPGMASGGMGDVLTGVLAALWAQNVAGSKTGQDATADAGPWRVAAAGAFWHAVAGDLAALEIGGTGIGAGDVAERLPRVRDHILAPREAPEELRRSLLGVAAVV